MASTRGQFNAECVGEAMLRMSADYEGVDFAIGLRNGNDRLVRVSIVLGYRVFCCDNLAFSGDFKPILQRHTKDLDLVESVNIAVDRIQRQWQPFRSANNFKRNHKPEANDLRSTICRLFADYKFPISLFRTIHNGYARPSHE